MQPDKNTNWNAVKQKNDLYRLAREEDRQFSKRHRNHPLMKHSRRKSFWSWLGRCIMGRSG